MRPLHTILLVSLCIFLAPFGRAWAIWQQDGTPVSNLSAQHELPAVIPDGAGGIIVVWEDHRGFDADIYAQRINSLGVLQWAAGGVPVSAVPGNQLSPKICTDGAGGAIVVWEGAGVLHAQRISSLGVSQWAQNGVAVQPTGLILSNPNLVPDGNGGAFISALSFDDGNQTVILQQLNGAGVSQWAIGEVPVGAGFGSALASDDAGGAVVSWTFNGIKAQRVAPDGTRLWGSPVTVASTIAQASNVIWAGGVGAIVVWKDARNGNWDIFAQRVDAQGAVQWGVNGAPVSLAAGDQHAPMIVTDGASGAIVAWEDYRAGSADVYAQRVNSFGTAQWPVSGSVVSTAVDAQTGPRVVADGAGGAVVTWLDHRSGTRNDVYAQRLAGSGGALWTINGFAVSTAAGDKAAPAIAPSGSLSAIVAWADDRVPPNIYAQRIEFTYGYWGYPEPIVDSITDMPYDNGGMMMLQWQASQQDLPAGSLIDHYSIWVQGPYPHPWMEAGMVPATGQPAYMMEVPTLADATPGDPAIHHFKVVAHSLPALGYDWESNVVEGSSVDNLAPAAPLSLVAQRQPGGDVSLQWDGVADPDLDHYVVYRASATGVTPIPANFLAVSTGAALLDVGAPANALFYIVTAVDVHSNEGGSSNEASVSGPTGAGDTPSPTVLEVLPNHPNPFSGSTELEIGLPRASDVSVEVFDVAGRVVRSIKVPNAAAGRQTVRFADHDDNGRTLPSGVYFYRVRAGASTLTRKMVIAR